MAAGPPGTLVYSVAIPGTQNPWEVGLEVALFSSFHKLPRTDTPSKLLKTTKIMKLVLRKCCGKFAPVDRKGAALPLCPAPRSRDGRH